MGYHRAGFDVVGVDNRPMPRYPFAFHQADALEYCREHGNEFDVIHASPPCQRYARVTAWRGDRRNYPDLISPIREIPDATGKPYIIENVEDACRELRFPVRLCGTMFGLPFRRHRLFEIHPRQLMMRSVCGHSPSDYSFDHGGKQLESVYREAMGLGWMTIKESRQAIPPVYTEFIGRRLMAYFQRHSSRCV